MIFPVSPSVIVLPLLWIPSLPSYLHSLREVLSQNPNPNPVTTTKPGLMCRMPLWAGSTQETTTLFLLSHRRKPLCPFYPPGENHPAPFIPAGAQG